MSASALGQVIEVIEPATGKAIATVTTADANRIRRVVDDAQIAQKPWATLNPELRMRLLSNWRDKIIAHATELATLLSRENGKPFHESLLHEVVALVDAIEYVVSTAPTLLQPQVSSPRWFKHRTHHIHRRARGVVALFTPFNFPLLIPGADAAAALAMGSAVVLKPSPYCPLIATRLVELAHAAGLPEAIFQVTHGDSQVAEMIIAGGINEVIFTGSVQNGRMVARECGERLIPCTLELGGNCPLIVLNDADLERTARAIMFGAFTNSGQSCMAVGRVLVPRPLLKPLVERLTPLVDKLRQGDPMSGTADLGALTTTAQVQRCRVHVEQAQSLGARAIAGRAAPSTAGNFLAPTIIADCDTTALVFREETFGPVLPIACFDSVDDAVALLNRDPAGLTAYVFGDDLARARSLAERLDFGQIVVDQVLLTYVCPEVPLSGLRQSGLGVVHGVDGLLSRTSPVALGMPRVRLPSALEFDWNDPKRAQVIAEGYLASQAALKRMFRWTAR